MIIFEVSAYQPDQMMPVKDDHMIEQLSSAATDPSLSDTILPRTAVSGAAWFDTHGLDVSYYLGAEDRVAVEYQILRRRVERERLTQLLTHPFRRRVECRIEM